MKEEERQSEGVSWLDRPSFYLTTHSPEPTIKLRSGQAKGRSLELSPGPTCGWQGPYYLSHHYCLQCTSSKQKSQVEASCDADTPIPHVGVVSRISTPVPTACPSCPFIWKNLYLWIKPILHWRRLFFTLFLRIKTLGLSTIVLFLYIQVCGWLRKFTFSCHIWKVISWDTDYFSLQYIIVQIGM